MDTNKLLDPEKWVDQYGDFLYRYALLRLRNPELAEDAVQETFLGALKSRLNFDGQSSERTWLTGILKHKITDLFRKMTREPLVKKNFDKDEVVEELFDKKGRWKERTSEWEANPNCLLENKEFIQILETCLSQLPSRLASAFTLREIDTIGDEEICKILNISSNNLGVILYRARMRLRRCMEINWFGHKGAKKS